MRIILLLLLLLVVAGGSGFALYWYSDAQVKARAAQRTKRALARDAGLDWNDPDGSILHANVVGDASVFEVEEDLEQSLEVLSYLESNGEPGWQQGEYKQSEVATQGGTRISGPVGYRDARGELSMSCRRSLKGKEVVLVVGPPIHLGLAPSPVWRPLFAQGDGLQGSWRRVGEELELRFATCGPELSASVMLQYGGTTESKAFREPWVVRIPRDQFPSWVERLRTSVQITRLVGSEGGESDSKERLSYAIRLLPPK